MGKEETGMLKEALTLWKKERNQKGTTLYKRLLVFFVSITVSLVLVFTILLNVFGITGKEEKTVANHMDTELSILGNAIYDDFGRIALGGIEIAENLIRHSENFFETQGITAEEFNEHPELIEPLLDEQMHVLVSTIKTRYCGGVFVMLDSTVNPRAQHADMAKAGIFLKKTQPKSTETIGVDIHCLRGPAQVARDNGIMLLGQWKMEYNVTDQEFFLDVMEQARNHPELPLSRLYYWTGRVTLKGNSEAGFLLCVPLRTEDGTVFGLCGLEVSDRLFKESYTPEGGNYESIFTVMAPACGEGIKTSQGLIAGNHYLTGNRWSNDLERQNGSEGFECFVSAERQYGGKMTTVRLYPGGSPYEEEAWCVAVLMPQELLDQAVRGNNPYLVYIVLVLLVLSLLASWWISRRYLRPVMEALDSIRSDSYEERKAAPYLEINDLFDYLDQRDRNHEEEIQKLFHEKSQVQSQFDQAQTYLSHLSEEKIPEVDQDSFEQFLECLHTLTPKEREIFDLYLEGKKAKEIMELTAINQNTMKYHNKNIYSKLGVTSRKQLMEYAALLKIKNEIGK